MATTLTDNFCRSCGGSTGESVADHEAKPNPHAQYLTQTEADARYTGSGSITTAITNHESAADPHAAAGYVKSSALAGYATQSYADTAASTAVTNHQAAADPHPAYAQQQTVSDRSGYAVYTDGTLTAGAPLTLTAATPTAVPNDAAATAAGQLPSDIASLYDETAGTILMPTVDDMLDVQIELTVDPTAAGEWIDVWIDDGSGGQLGRQTFSLIKGAVPHSIVHRLQLPGSAALVANGGTVTVESADTPDVYGVRLVAAVTARPKII